MKYLLLMFLLVGCNVTFYPNRAEPKFVMNQNVMYKVSKFYSSVCSGKGKVVALYSCMEGCQYEVRTPYDEIGCPGSFSVKEEDLK